MATSEVVGEVNYGDQNEPQIQLDRIFPQVIEEGGYKPPHEGDWAHIGQSGNVLFGFRDEEGTIVRSDSIGVTLLTEADPELARRLTQPSADVIYDNGNEKVKIRPTVSQKEILSTISNFAINKSKLEG